MSVGHGGMKMGVGIGAGHRMTASEPVHLGPVYHFRYRKFTCIHGHALMGE